MIRINRRNMKRRRRVKGTERRRNRVCFCLNSHHDTSIRFMMQISLQCTLYGKQKRWAYPISHTNVFNVHALLILAHTHTHTPKPAKAFYFISLWRLLLLFFFFLEPALEYTANSSSDNNGWFHHRVELGRHTLNVNVIILHKRFSRTHVQ